MEKTRRASAAEPADTRTKPSITYVHTMADLAAKSRLIAPSRFYVEVLGHPRRPLGTGLLWPLSPQRRWSRTRLALRP